MRCNLSAATHARRLERAPSTPKQRAACLTRSCTWLRGVGTRYNNLTVAFQRNVDSYMVLLVVYPVGFFWMGWIIINVSISFDCYV